MKEASPLRQQVSGPVYSSSTSRDLDVVFEENEPSQYNTLNFLRPKPTYSTPYVDNNSTSTVAASSIGMTSSPATTVLRRPRAGTMPSFIMPPSIPDLRPNTNSALLLNTIEQGRHRSGSLNLPPPVDASFWNLRHDGPLSPSSEQLLQNDSDFSIARTMRSLGLEEESKEEKKGLFHRESPPEFHMPSRSLLSGNNRNRSYSVNTDDQMNRNKFTAIEEFTSRQMLNRPRASSMGRAENILPVPPFWNNSNNRSSPLVSMQEEEYLSLGDSELLANMLPVNDNNNNSNTAVYDQQQQQQIQMMGEKPYMHYSQSTPTTIRDTNSNNYQPQQVTTRSLWVGNIDNSITIELLTQIFSSFGPIESIRLLIEKECGFVNFYQIEDAIRAKEEVLSRGGRIGTCVVRIGFGKADVAITTDTNNNGSQPTRALWLGNIPGNTTPTSLQNLFLKYGPIESVRVLSHKNCGFINFEVVANAVAARDALLQNEIGGFTGSRVGFAKIPPPSITKATVAEEYQEENHDAGLEDATHAWQNDLYDIMLQFNLTQEVARTYVKNLKISSVYFDSIPAVPELTADRQFDAARLRDMRKRADSATNENEEAEAIAQECMTDIAEISSDYVGNTVVQRLFEKCSEETKTEMLQRIGPHLAAISIHKNGTWATQKMIDLAKTPEQIQLISQHLKPYIPPLLLDQFGNYAVQCCLRLGEPTSTQFIFDAMVEKVMNIAQGRFGSRSMRGILESEFITSSQQKFVASSLCQNAISLSANANGALLLSWLIESTDIDHRMQVIAQRLIPRLPQLCVHKLGSQIIYKLINQVEDLKAQEMMLTEILRQENLIEILADQIRGLVFIQKIIACPLLTQEQKEFILNQVSVQLQKMDGPGHKKLLDLLLLQVS